MKQIKIYTLSDCGVCKKLKSELNNRGIVYIEYECHETDDRCDALEAMCNTSMYPFARIKVNSDLTTYLALSTDYTKVNKKIQIDKFTYVYYLDSINNMLSILENV